MPDYFYPGIGHDTLAAAVQSKALRIILHRGYFTILHSSSNARLETFGKRDCYGSCFSFQTVETRHSE